MSDLIDRQAAMDAPEIFTKDCNPEHFVGHQKFIEYMDNDEIGSFGNWQYANGFNMGLTAAEVAIKKLPSAEPEIVRCKECKHQEKFFHTDRRRKDGGYYIYGCELAEEYSHVCLDDDFCSRAERRTNG